MAHIEEIAENENEIENEHENVQYIPKLINRNIILGDDDNQFRTRLNFLGTELAVYCPLHKITYVCQMNVVYAIDCEKKDRISDELFKIQHFESRFIHKIALQGDGTVIVWSGDKNPHYLGTYTIHQRRIHDEQKHIVPGSHTSKIITGKNWFEINDGIHSTRPFTK